MKTTVFDRAIRIHKKECVIRIREKRLEQKLRRVRQTRLAKALKDIPKHVLWYRTHDRAFDEYMSQAETIDLRTPMEKSVAGHFKQMKRDDSSQSNLELVPTDSFSGALPVNYIVDHSVDPTTAPRENEKGIILARINLQERRLSTAFTEVDVPIPAAIFMTCDMREPEIQVYVQEHVSVYGHVWVRRKDGWDPAIVRVIYALAHKVTLMPTLFKYRSPFDKNKKS